MIKNYFFIPASKSKYIQKSETLQGIGNRIFDLEDSILNKDVDYSINLLRQVKQRDTDWVRIPLEISIFEKFIGRILEMGYKNFVIPKFAGIDELTIFLEKILAVNEISKFILLIENPKALVELNEILKKYKNCILGFGLGSHDFSLESGIENDIDYLRHIRINLIILAKAYEKEAIDIVSMSINNKDEFIKEIIDGFKCGYRAKFLIHPLQLEFLNSYPFYSYQEVNKYKEMLSYYETNVKGQEALFSYESRVYEKMHINKFKKIIDWGLKFYGTDRQIL